MVSSLFIKRVIWVLILFDYQNFINKPFFMKNFIILFFFLISAISSYAQSPDSISYQAIIRDPEGALLIEQAISVRIGIYQGAADGTKVYEETHSITTSADGQMTVLIGSGTTSDSFSAIDWSAGTYFVKREIDPNGGTDYLISGSSQFLTIPYSKFSSTAGSALDLENVRVSATGDTLYIGIGKYVIVPGISAAN